MVGATSTKLVHVFAPEILFQKLLQKYLCMGPELGLQGWLMLALIRINEKRGNDLSAHRCGRVKEVAVLSSSRGYSERIRFWEKGLDIRTVVNMSQFVFHVNDFT